MKMFRTGFMVAAAAVVCVQGVFAQADVHTLDADELKARMMRAYRDVNSYHERCIMRTTDYGDGLAPFSEGQFALDRENQRILSDSSYFHGGESAEPGTLMVCSGTRLRYKDLRPCLDRNGEDINPRDLYREITVEWPLNYHVLAAENVGLGGGAVPMLFGVDLLEEMERVTAHSGKLAMQAVSPRTDDPRHRVGLRISGWTGRIAEKLTAMTLWLDPETFLVTQITSEAGDKGVVGVTDIEVLRCDQYPLPQELFTFDLENMEPVFSKEEFEGMAPHPLKGKMMPSLALKNIDGVSVDVPGTTGDTIALLFWSEYNGRSGGVKMLQEWARENQKPVRVYGMNLVDSEELVRQTAERLKLDRSMILLADDEARKVLPVQAGVHAFVIHKGRVLHTHLDEFHEVTAAVDSLLEPLPVSVLLEQGIYTEETVGDLERAIEIYSEIVADGQANRKVVAEALLRLAKCHLAEGHKELALEELQKLVDQYPDQETLVERAKGLIAELKPTPLFPTLENGRLVFPVVMELRRPEDPGIRQDCTVYESDRIEIRWDVDVALERKIGFFEVQVVSLPGKRKGTGLVAKGVVPTDGKYVIRDLKRNHLPVGTHRLRLYGYNEWDEVSRRAQRVAIGEVYVHVKPTPYTQIDVNDIQPNGDIRFSSVQQRINTGHTPYRTFGFINSDFVHVEEMFDDEGRKIEFKETHENNIYRYRGDLNDAVQTGGLYLLGSRGRKEKLVSKLVGNEYIYHMNHTPGTDYPTRRVEIYRLPQGAKLLETTPDDLPHRMLDDGRVEILVDTMIPPGGSLLTEFRYQLENVSEQYQSLDLQPEPWADGEVLYYRMATKAGVSGGQQIWMANEVLQGGKACWEIEQRTIVPFAGTTVFSNVLVEKERFGPIKSHASCMSINVTGEYRKGVIAMQKGEKSWEIKTAGPVYDNDQVLYLMRRLPLAEGYDATFRVMSLLAGSAANEVRIRVAGRETVEVPAGIFDCWKINLQVYVNGNKTLMEQDFWCAVEGREMVKVAADMLSIELVKKETRASLGSLPLEEHGAVLNLPENWLGYELPKESLKAHGEIVRLLPPEMNIEAMLCKTVRQPAAVGLNEIVAKDVEALKGFFKNYTVRKDSVVEKEINGMPAYIYTADYEGQGKAKVEYRAYYVSESSIFWFIFRMEPEQLDSLKPELDALIEGLRIRK